MASYMFLLYENPSSFEGVSPAEMQQIIGKYKAWGDGLRAAGKLLDSSKLADGEGRVVRGGESPARVTDGPYSETKEVVAGYFKVQAATYDEAVSLARECPHVGLGGTVEIRRLDEV